MRGRGRRLRFKVTKSSDKKGVPDYPRLHKILPKKKKKREEREEGTEKEEREKKN